jgi:hypothetical protein
MFALLAIFVLASAPAQAQATRTWVSGVGDDANPCSRTAPCKTFAGAISKTAVGGEINVLDPGGFGAVTITKAITISSSSDEAGVLVSGTNGIIVQVANAGDNVILRGLDIEGLGTGINGVLVNTGGNVTVENCMIDHFTTSGIAFNTSVAGSQLHISNTIIRNTSNGSNNAPAISVAPSAAGTVTVDHTRIEHNNLGLIISTGNGAVSVTESIAANQTNGAGFATTATGATLNLEHSLITHNTTGLSCVAGSFVRVGNCAFFDNPTSVANSANCFSFKNNDIDATVTPAMPTLTLNQ